MQRRIIFILLFHFFTTDAQTYHSPLKIPLRLAGNFCEVRSDHFHSGIDIKTDGHEGMAVFAVDDGYISRVKISADGFGKVIYITHPGNRLTVYAHLHSFTGSFADSIETMQYKKKSFEVEWFPDSILFPVRKGQQIAWSGNSGGSESPHLHFEIRDAHSEEPLNPLLNGFFIADSIKPVIEKIALYEFSNGRFIYDNDYPLRTSEQKTDRDTFVVNYDTVSMSFMAHDEMNDSLPSECGIYSLILLNNYDTVYHYAFNKMSFSETRNVNGYIDVLHQRNKKETLLRCFTLPGSKFNAFKNSGKGYIVLKDSATATLKLIVADANGNRVEKSFFITRVSTNKKSPGQKDANIVAYPNKEIIVKWQDAGIFIPADAFFESTSGVDFNLKHIKSNKPVMKIEPSGLSLSKKMSINFKPSKVYRSILDKLVIVELTDKGKFLRSLATKNNKRMITAYTWLFGKYSFVIDTISPVFSDLTLRTDSIFNEKWLEVKIKDGLSGISAYSGKINNEWKLFEYDRKNETLAYKLKPGEMKFDLQLEATDQKGNKGIFSKAVEITDENFIK